MLIAFMARVAGDTVDAFVKQALSTFGVDTNPATPRSTGTTACDTTGLALMGRTIAHAASGTATTTPATALAEFATRDEAIVQNVDEGGGILRVWLASQPTVKFQLAPFQSFTWHGKDEIRVDTASATAAWVAVDR